MNSKKTDLIAQLFPDQKIGMIHSLISHVKVGRLLCILIIILLNIQLKAQVIPYTEALNNAAIVQSSISNLDTNGIIIGNGDINALIYSGKDELIMHPAKNDVWDARLVTANDKPLLKVNVEAHSWTGGSQPPSWNTPYPTQTPPALIRIQSSGKVKEARMDLRSAMASILTSTGKTTIRALAQKNVYFIETDRKVILEGFPQTFLPPAEITQSDGMTIVKQHLPEDPDYPGMEVYTVLGSKGNSHAISVVTSRESSNALSDAKKPMRISGNNSGREVALCWTTMIYKTGGTGSYITCAVFPHPVHMQLPYRADITKELTGMGHGHKTIMPSRLSGPSSILTMSNFPNHISI